MHSQGRDIKTQWEAAFRDPFDDELYENEAASDVMKFSSSTIFVHLSIKTLYGYQYDHEINSD